MKEQLVYQVVYSQFPKQLFLVEDACFIKREGSIHPVVGNRTIDKVIVMGKTKGIPIVIYEVYPFFGGSIKPKRVLPFHLVHIDLIDIDIPDTRLMFVAQYPVLCLVIIGGGIEAFAIVEGTVGLAYLRFGYNFKTSVIYFHCDSLPSIFASISSMSHWRLWVCSTSKLSARYDATPDEKNSDAVSAPSIPFAFLYCSMQNDTK